ncbi:MAG: hypothetical protein M1822_005161 [Bathelium mastoideum]|nr:MAG: hypothetical protein M1822_005161 [Bathelium mastoideum]
MTALTWNSSRRTNGATQTFRRTSLAASSNHASLREGSTASSNIYVPPHIASSRNGVPSEARYSREQLLDLLRQQQEAVNQAQDLSALFVGGWDGRDRNGANHVDHNVRGEGPNSLPQGAEICWELNGGLQPLGLSEMTEEEKELFTTSVNSPIKPSVQNTNKDGSARDGLSLRKSSITRDPSNPSAYGLTSPTAPRSGPRRREPSDSYPFPTNSTTTPTGGSKFFREDNNPAQPPPALLRRRTDFKEGTPTTEAESTERDKSQEEGTGQPTPVGTLKRSTTGPLSAGLSGPSSPWSATPQNTGFNPIGGAFGSFTLGASQATPTGENRPGFGSMRGQSRFKGLMSKETNEESNRNLAEKQSAGELGKINESSQTQARQPPSWTDARRERSFTTDTDEGARTGSAALGGAQDISPLQSHVAPINATPARGETRDDLSFSAFGMTPDHLPGGVRDMLHNRDQLQLLAQQQQSISALHEPMSPTDTNPYQSPETHPQDVDTDGSDIQTAHLPGLGNHVGEQGSLPGLSALGGFGGFGRTHMGPESDRSQTSSTGPNRQFPNIGGLGGLPGLGNATWGSSATMGTPLRERTSTHTFADNYLGTSAELQSPNLAGLGPGNLFGSGPGMSFGASSNVPRGGRLGSLFPTAMQDEMRSREDSIQHDENIIGEGRDRSLSGFGGAGPNRYDMGMGRESDSPFHAARGSLGDILGSGADAATTPLGQSQSQSQSGAPGAASSAFAQGPQQRASQQSDLRQGQGSGSSGSSQPPPAQQRTMVMPDRMRWIYRDPQGNTQGPWSGLEMHDWYKAGFFSPELLVKKYEDPDYEPLAQLIRRIGNSREPFLVPQIGIPHGPPGGGPSAWSGQSTVPNTQGTGTGQPPFASAFPSFGTTLTAEQQNALERRKQEEQYLMARQKEHLQAQHQYQRQMQMAGQHSVLPQQLQHHSSAHSLHSQPSFGSITSPSGYQQSPSQGQIQTAQGGPGFFDNSFRPGQATNAGPMAGGQDMLNRMKEQDMSGLLGRLNLGQGSQPPFGGQPSQFDQQDSTHAQQVAQMLNDRSRLQREQAEYESQQRFNQNEEQATAARLQQFQGLRGSQSQEPTASTEGMIRNLPGQLSEALQQRPQQEMDEEDDPVATIPTKTSPPKNRISTDSLPPEPLSLTEQVQKAASAKQSPTPQSPWGKVDTSMPQPFPPPPSQSPLPAPAAQRNRHNVAEALTVESRSRSETPVETPTSIAPWAKEPSEAPKGPSLKEIQELEAKKAAQREAEEAAARRAVYEKELLAQAMAPQPAPGLPTSSTWGSGQSPVTPGSAAASAWAKPLAGKPTGSTAAGAGKTLAQIQKEEEARKKMAAVAKVSTATTASSSGTAPPLSSGKRYADLAGKTAPPQPNLGGAWTTVGANGKTKTTAPPTATVAGATSRSASGGVVAASASRPKPTATPTRSATMGGAVMQANAHDEFKKWAITELRPDLKGNISVDDFVGTLMALPFDSDMITEAVHSSSQTIDSRHFAEEFIRRRKLADRGMVDPTGTSSPASATESKSGGWSEVAKKGPAAKEEPNNFKVVAAKKKGGKR